MRYKLGHRVHNSCASGSARRCSSAQSEPLRRRKAEWFETAQTRAWRPFQPRKRDEHNGSFASHANGDTCHMFGTRLRNRGGRRSSPSKNNLDASYTISFARVRVGDITASLVLGDTAYKISARGRAWGPGILTVGARKPLSRPQEICVRLTTPGHPPDCRYELAALTKKTFA